MDCLNAWLENNKRFLTLIAHILPFGRVKGPTYTAAHVSMLLILPVKVLTCKILSCLRKAWVDIGLSSTDICR